MAKQEKKPEQTQQTVSSHPDPKKNAIVLRYPKDGSVKVVGDLKLENNKPKIGWVEPQTKNHPSFYQVTNRRYISEVFKALRMQAEDKKTLPEIYLCPYDKVGPLAEQLVKLQVDDKDEEALAMGRLYRTSTQSLDRVMFDKERMQIGELVAAGFDVEQMEKDGVFDQMQYGIDSKPYQRKETGSEHLQFEGAYFLRPTANEYGEIILKGLTPKGTQDFLEDKNLRIQLTPEDIALLRNGKTLPHAVLHEGEWCYAGLNKNTNHMVYVPLKDVITPGFIYNAQVTPAQYMEFSQGRQAKMEGCSYQHEKDNTFSGVAGFDVVKMKFTVPDPTFIRPYISPNFRKQMTPEMLKAYLAGEEIDGSKLKDQYGKRLSKNVYNDKTKNVMTYVRLKGEEVSQAQTKNQEQAASFAEEIPQEPDMDLTMPQEGQKSRGQAM